MPTSDSIEETVSNLKKSVCINSSKHSINQGCVSTVHYQWSDYILPAQEINFVLQIKSL